MTRWLVSSVILGAMCLCVNADDPKPADLAKKPQWQRMLSGEDAKTAEKLDKRIGELIAVDNYAEAIQSANELLALRQSMQGEDHWETRDVHFAIIRFQKVNQLDEKSRREWRAVERKQKENMVLVMTRNYDQALQNQEASLKLKTKILGDSHPYTASSLSNKSAILFAQGNHETGMELLKKALAIQQQTLGENHPNTASSMVDLADQLTTIGQRVEGEPLFRNALVIQREVFGPDHLTTVATIADLADNLILQNRYEEALYLHRHALRVRRDILGDDHLGVGKSSGSIAVALDKQGKFAESQIYHENAIKILVRVFGENQPATASIFNNLADNLQSQGKFTEAQRYYESAVAISRKTLGANHPQYAMSIGNMAINLTKLKKIQEAKKLAQEAIDIHLKSSGSKHPDTGNSYNIMANILNVEQRQSEALLLSQKALEIHRTALGELHHDTTISYFNVALNLMIQRRVGEAEPLLLRAILSHEASRLVGSSGLDRATFSLSSPRALLAIVLQPQNSRDAWEQIELSLARSLLDQQTAGKETLTETELKEQSELTRNHVQLQSRILKQISKPKQAEIEANQLTTLIEERRKIEDRLSTLIVNASVREVAPFEKIQKSLALEEVLLFYVDLADPTGIMNEHFACVLRVSGNPIWIRLPGSGEQETWTKADSQLPGQLRMALANSSPSAEVESLSRRLHAQRIAPILPHLTGVKTLHVVGVQAMAGIPIEALTSDFLVDYVPSGSYLARLKPQAPTAANLFALGDPMLPDVMPKTIAPPLPTGGILITQVVPGGAGEKALLKPGDVLLKYGDKELSSVDDLKTSITANEKVEKNTLTLWRDGKTNTKDVPPGKLGIVLDLEPAPQAIAYRRKTNETLAKLSRGGDWAELPGTAAEIASLQSLFPQNTILTRNDANPKKLAELVKADKLKEYRYLHFATHGEANSVVAFQSSLILHGDDKSVARLTAREILDTWKLNAELVTLSACETAIGKEGGGDGLLGFAQAFLTAGARSVCLSLWKVDDAATALLMDRFYRNLLGKRDGLDKPMPKALALDEAKRWLRTLSTEDAATRLATISKGVSRGAGAKAIELAPPKPPVEAKPDGAKKPFDHPKYWAAFILIGDPN